MSSAPDTGAPAKPAPADLPSRRFVNILLGTGLLASAASFLYPVLRYLVPPKLPDLGGDAVLAARLSEMKPNTAKTFRFGTRPGLLVETSAGEYRAMSATCTHLGCTVQYRPDLREIWCACHNGMYDLNGRNISGPPPRPLEAFEVQVRGDEIFVRRKQEA
ncbi:MAG: Rieske (2Fe-2S) protein [Candidatus Korobacteraceae bacterium]